MEIKNYERAYIRKITKVKNVILQHNYDEKRTFFERELFMIEFDNGDILYMKLKPKKYSNCINGIDFRLENTKLTRKNIIYEEII